MENHSHKNRNQSDATAAAGETLVGQAGHILVIDDDRGIRETLSDVLRLRDYTVETAGLGQEGLKKLSTYPFDVAIVDIKLPDISGSDLLPLMKEASPEIEVILITAYASLNSAIEAINGNAFAYITKPFEMEHLLATLDKALEKRRLAIENRRLYQMAQQELANHTRAEEEIQRQRQRLAILHDI
ncbi:MAG: response regulator, partial [Candidatus Binatia bacterium]